MYAYEVDRPKGEIEWTCPECGCNVGESNEPPTIDDVQVLDLRDSTYYSCTETYGANDVTEFTIYVINAEWHDCGCDCDWLEKSDIEGHFRRIWEQEYGPTMYACGECNSQYENLDSARQCCKQDIQAKNTVSTFEGTTTNQIIIR